MCIIIRIALMRTEKSLRTLIGLIVSILGVTNVISSNPGSTYELLRGWQWSSERRGSFANSAFYNARDDAIVLTGNHPAASSDCFLAQVSLSQDERRLEWSRVYKTKHSEACTASVLDVHQNKNASKDEDTPIYAFGFSSPQSFTVTNSNYHVNNNNSSSSFSSGAKLIGFGFVALPMIDPPVTNLSSLQLLNFNPYMESLISTNSSTDASTLVAPRTSSNNNSISTAPNLKGLVFDAFKVQYPVVVDTFKNGDVLLACIVSDYDDITSSLNTPDAAITDVPFGKDFKIFLQRLSISYEENSFHKRWTRIISTTSTSSVFLSDVRVAVNQQKKEIIVIAGTTSGRGDGLASSNANETADSNWSSTKTNSDYDGFVSKLYGDTGEFVVRPKNVTGWNISTGSMRISSQAGYEDRVSGLCVDPPSSSHNGYIYIIGSTEGQLGDPTFSVSNDDTDRRHNAFVTQLDLETMETLWTRQLGPEKNNSNSNQDVDASGVGCTVSKDGGTLFVSGVISNDGHLPNQTSFGEDDVWIASYNTSSGSLNFALQIGSDKRDLLAKHNSILLDANENIVLIGTSKGYISSPGKATLSDDDDNVDNPEAFLLQYGVVTTHEDITSTNKFSAFNGNGPVSFVALTLPPTPAPTVDVKTDNTSSLTHSPGNSVTGDERAPEAVKESSALVTFGVAAFVAVFVAGSLGSILILRNRASKRDRRQRASRQREDELVIHHDEQHNISGEEAYNFNHIHDDDTKGEFGSMTYPDMQQSFGIDPSLNLGGHNLFDTFDLSRASSSQRLGVM